MLQTVRDGAMCLGRGPRFCSAWQIASCSRSVDPVSTHCVHRRGWGAHSWKPRFPHPRDWQHGRPMSRCWRPLQPDRPDAWRSWLCHPTRRWPRKYCSWQLWTRPSQNHHATGNNRVRWWSPNRFHISRMILLFLRVVAKLHVMCFLVYGQRDIGTFNEVVASMSQSLLSVFH